ncbi:hypothetical protein CR513_01451, partial [Mucuna pruriens]
MRYQRIEKAALALIITSRRLRPYFQGYNIVVWMDLPIIKQVLRKPDLAGRMVEWSIQLSEFDISYENRGHIKAQTLADFIIEMTAIGSTISEDNEWFLFVDEASNQAGSGPCIMLEGLNGLLIEQSLHFKFKANNNQVEYETLLAGMKLARELEAKILTVKSDSKLVIGQVNREYQVRDPQLSKYWEKVTKMASTFKKFTLLHVVQEQSGGSTCYRSWPVPRKEVEEMEVFCVEGMKTWMSPFLEYLREDRLPSDPTKAKKLVKDASKYIVVGASLSRYFGVKGEESEYVIREVHKGVFIPNSTRTGEVLDRGSRLFHKADRSGTGCHDLDRENQTLLLEEDNLPIQLAGQNSLGQWDTVRLPVNHELLH